MLVVNQRIITRQAAHKLEAAVLRRPQTKIPVRHYYSRGVYAKEITIPAGVIVVGKIHKYEQLNIMSKGDMSVLVAGRIVRVQAPFTSVGEPGMKRIALTHTETVWTTILGTNCKDPDEIEAYFTAGSEEEYVAFCEQEKTKCLT